MHTYLSFFTYLLSSTCTRFENTGIFSWREPVLEDRTRLTSAALEDYSVQCVALALGHVGSSEIDRVVSDHHNHFYWAMKRVWDTSIQLFKTNHYLNCPGQCAQCIYKAFRIRQSQTFTLTFSYIMC